MKGLSTPFILRPVATSLLMLAFLIAGLVSWRLLPVAALPQVDYPIIQVFTFQPGAGPEVTARTITAPLERYLGQIPGLKQMSSTSSGGASVITLQFDLGEDLGVAEQEVQAAMNTADSLLPNDLPTPPIYRKVNPADAPILTLAITSDSLPLPEVHDLVDTRMAQKLAQISGVGLVSLAGGQRPAVRVLVNPMALASYGLSLDQVRQSIAATNVNQPKGSFDGPTRSTMLDANDQIRSVEDYRKLILTWQNGAPLRLGDVATIIDGAEDRFLAAWANGQPAVLLNVQRQPGANVIEVTDRVRELLPQLAGTLPSAVDVTVLTDRTHSIRASVRDTQKELLFAVALVVLVTFVFLRSIPATIIPSIAVPLSLVGTFAFMYLMDFSVNNLTLMALTIATGFVVDDAIVMLENVARHREMGETPMQAALKGAGEIGFTLMSLTFSLVAVLIPLLFMPDVVGRLFHEFAITLAVAIVISLVVSLTLTPMMCARMFSTPPQEKSDGLLHGVIERYGRALDWVLERQTPALLVMLGTIALTGLLYLAVDKDFFPVQDSNVIQVVTEGPQDISFTAMAERQQLLAQALLQDPGIESLSSFIGVDGVNVTVNSGRILVNLPPHDQRDESLFEVMARLRERAASVDGISAWFQPVQELTIEDRVSRTQYQFSLTSLDSGALHEWVPQMVAALNARPELDDVAADLQQRGMQAYVEIDRDAAARFGLDVTDIANTLYNAFGQRQIATLFTQSNQYRVIMEVDPQFAGDPESLQRLFITTADGSSVPLASVARVQQRAAPLLINHQGQFPATTVSFNLADGASLG
ncbi:MAG TPA: multidrug transporter subunit MdtC, partial [Pseudomonas sp.]|nr:multidrug transporter subunit MdtC [Pseudomonas sp.]